MKLNSFFILGCGIFIVMADEWLSMCCCSRHVASVKSFCTERVSTVQYSMAQSDTTVQYSIVQYNSATEVRIIESQRPLL